MTGRGNPTVFGAVSATGVVVGLVLLLLLSVALSGCGHRAAGPRQVLNPAEEQTPAVGYETPQRSESPLPGIWELDDLFGGAKSVRNGSQVVIAGADYSEADSTTGRDESIEVEDTSLNLRAYEPGDFTYAVFGQLVGDGVMGGGRDDDIPLLSLFQTEPCDYGGERDEDIPLFFYIGIADYTLGSWRWFGPYSDADPEVSLNNEELQNRFKSPSDMLYIAVLAAAGGKQVSQLPREGLVADLPFQPAERMASQLEDPAGVRVKAIVTNADSGIGTLPQAVTGLSAVVGGSSITVSWEENPDPDVTLHQVFRQDLTTGGPVESLGDVPMPTLEYEDMTAVADTTYRYSVRAVNDTGAGGLGGIEAGPPIIKAVAPLAGTQGDTVTFAVTLDGSEPFTYAWDFGGGATPNTSTEATPTVTLGTINTYSATLIVTNAYGNDTYPFTLTVTQPTYSVSGHVEKDTSGGLQGATLTLTPGNRSATTNSSGAYTITAVSNGSYTLTPSLSGWSFSPTSQSVSVSSGDVTGKNFTASEEGPSEWHIVTLDIAIGWGAPGSFGIVNGNPAGSYRDSADGYLKYVRASDASGSSWGTPVNVETQTWEGEYISLAVVDGNPAISYFDANNDILKYVRASNASGSAWGSPVTVDSAVLTVEDACLVVVNGRPAISYWDETNQDLKYVRASDAQGSSWGSPITVGSAGADGGKGSNSLAVVNGNPAIICLYYQGTNYEQNIVYVRATDANGDTWGTPVTVDSTSDNDGGPCLAVVNGYPAISYYDFTNHYLKYVQATDASGGSWGTPVTVDSEGETHYFSSLATVNGNPAISYSTLNMDWTNADLKYVRASDTSGSSWGTPVTVDSAGDVGYGASLVVADIYPAIFYYDRTNGDMKYAYFGP